MKAASASTHLDGDTRPVRAHSRAVEGCAPRTAETGPCGRRRMHWSVKEARTSQAGWRHGQLAPQCTACGHGQRQAARALLWPAGVGDGARLGADRGHRAVHRRGGPRLVCPCSACASQNQHTPASLVLSEMSHSQPCAPHTCHLHSACFAADHARASARVPKRRVLQAQSGMGRGTVCRIALE